MKTLQDVMDQLTYLKAESVAIVPVKLCSALPLWCVSTWAASFCPSAWAAAQSLSSRTGIRQRAPTLKLGKSARPISV